MNLLYIMKKRLEHWPQDKNRVNIPAQDPADLLRIVEIYEKALAKVCERNGSAPSVLSGVYGECAMALAEAKKVMGE